MVKNFYYDNLYGLKPNTNNEANLTQTTQEIIDIFCSVCEKHNHKTDDCRVIKKWKKESGFTPETKPKAKKDSQGMSNAKKQLKSMAEDIKGIKPTLFMVNSGRLLEDEWILDSGATIHVCKNENKFIELKPCNH